MAARVREKERGNKVRGVGMWVWGRGSGRGVYNSAFLNRYRHLHSFLSFAIFCIFQFFYLMTFVFPAFLKLFPGFECE
jgi:hypothetical protein